ncbi:MAG: c-type cytochrome, partial [Bacteroidetes bacterium]
PDPSILAVIGKMGFSEQLNFLTEIASTQGNPYTSDAAYGLLNAARDRGIFPSKNKDKAVKNLFTFDDESIQETACALTGYWKSKEFIDVLKQKLSRSNTSYGIQESAAQSLAMFDTDDIRKFFAQIVAEDRSMSLTKLAVSALVRLDLTEGVEAIIELLITEPDKETIIYLINTIIKKEGAFKAFVIAIDGRTLATKTASQASRIVQASGREGAEELMAALAKAGSVKIATTNGQRTLDLIAKLKDGDAEKGKEIYHRPELACISCHKLKGVGLTDIGPDLGSIGASAPADYIIESLIEPSKKIKEGFKSSIITTKNGDFYAGSIIFENAKMIRIKTSAGAEVSIQKSKIKSRETSKVSMMPAGLTDALNEGELIDLLKYITELGKSR